jgi:CarD family transcriptional regulator
MTVMVPFTNAETIGLRKLSKNPDVTRVLAYLAGPSFESLQDWKIRFKINSEKMLTGSLLQIAEVFKQLVRLQAEKPLSFREKKMLDRSRTMLISEVSQSRNISETEAIVLMQKSLTKSGFQFPEPS